jgi:flagellar M-ring protein FliF
MAFTPGQKAVTIIAVLGLAIGAYAFSSWTSKVSYAPLYTNLAASDASAIVDKLNSAKEPYKLSAGGTEIDVPQKDVYTERLAMSSAGLPNSGQSGFSLLDHEGVTTSDFVQHVDYQRALEGELDNTITALQGVQAAQVNLALPEDNVYTDASQQTTAAVLLTMAPGATLTTDQVRTVVNLVSASVPGLTANNVSVSDSTGRVLSAAGSGLTDATSMSTQTEATQAYDTQLSSSVQQMLDQVLGPGHSSVTVNAVLNFDSATTNSHTYTYASGVPPLAVSSQTESYSSNGTAAPGVLGAGTPSAGATPTASAGNYSSGTVTQNNAVGTVDQTTVTAPGAVKQLGVSVVVDKSAATTISPDQLRSLVSAAVGLNTKRGDSLAIATLPFDTSSAKQAAAAAAAASKAAAQRASQASFMSMIKTGGAVLIVLVVIIVTAIISRRRRPEPFGAPTPADDLDQFLATLDGPNAGDVPIEPAMRVVPPAASQLERNRRVVEELADEQPDDMARLLRNWMNSKGQS